MEYLKLKRLGAKPTDHMQQPTYKLTVNFMDKPVIFTLIIELFKDYREMSPLFKILPFYIV